MQVMSISNTYFVYPFLFEQEDFNDNVLAFNKKTINYKDKEIKMWIAQEFPDDDLLAHVADFLNPSENKETEKQKWINKKFFKQAKLQNGSTVMVPLFINIGDKIRVDTRSRSYAERVKG